MPRNYTVSRRADNDIDDILEYGYRHFGLEQTINYKTELEQCLALLADNPKLGRQCDDIRAGYQRHEHGRHIIFYRQRKADILIIRVIHDSMDVKRHL